MRAVVAQRFGDSSGLSVEEIPTPLPGAGQVRVKVAAASINPVDLYNMVDPTWAQITAPCVPGYDIAGTIDLVGDGVDEAAIGRRCLAMMHFPSGQGGYAEYAVLSEELVGYLNDGADLHAAASIPLAGGTAWEIMRRVRPLGERMLVLGASGGVGLFLLQLARDAGNTVVGVGRARNHEVMRASGATGCVDYTSPNFLADAAGLANGQFDTIADLVGGPMINDALPYLRDNGKVCAIATPDLDIDHVIDHNQSFHGLLIRDAADRTQALAALFNAGKLSTNITHVLPLDDVIEAHRLVDSGEAGGDYGPLRRTRHERHRRDERCEHFRRKNDPDFTPKAHLGEP